MQIFIQNILYLLVALLPLTFTFINSELFEFPKFIILLSGTILISALWLYDAYITKQFRPSKLSKLSYAVLFILLTQTIATIFSIHPYTSFWGYYSRFHGGLLTTICYTIIYFASLRYMDTKSTHKLIKISIYTSILVGLYAMLERLGIDKHLWIQDVQSRPFSTLGQPNWLAAYLLPNIFLSLFYAQISVKKCIYYFAIFITTLALFLTRSRSGILALFISMLVYWPLLARQFGGITSIKKQLIFALLTFFGIGLVLGTPYTRSLSSYFSSTPAATPIPLSGTSLENGGTESGDIRKIVWSGALDLIQRYPMLGTGPETFAYTYYWARPIAHNMTSEWDFLYNKAHNEYLNMAAGAGLLGLLAYLYFHLVVFLAAFTRVPKSKKINQDQDLAVRAYYPVLGATITGFAITNFFGFSVIPVYFMMMIIPVLGYTLNKPVDMQRPFPPLMWLAIPVLLIYPYILFVADAKYARGKAYFDAGDQKVAIPLLNRAVALRPGLDLYHATLGEAYATVGQVDLVRSETEINRKLNPHHLNFYKSRAKSYLTLATIDSSFTQPAAEELEKARALAPTDPKLAYNLALVYSRLDRLADAETQLKDAIALKPNYPEPYYALTLIYEQDKKAHLIPDLLKSARDHLSTYSGALSDKMEKYQK